MAGWPDACAFADVWQRAVASRPDQTFLVFEGPDGHVAEWTYAEFDVTVGCVAATLRRLGVEPGSAVHLVLTNSPSFVAVWLAAVRLGAWIVPSDPMGRSAELAGHIARTRPVVAVCAGARADVYRAALESAGNPQVQVIEVDESDVDLAEFGEIELGDWPVVTPTDRAAVMFTSGTTGLPKGVEVTQANYAFAGKVMADAAGLRHEHRALVVLPLFHANAQYYSFAASIWVGAAVVLMHTFSASGFVAQARRHHATHASLFAAPMRMILARGVTPDTEPATLQHCWYAQNITIEQHAALTHVFGCAPRQLYGMTETIPAVLTDEAAEPDPLSMGFVTPGCEVDVQDADCASVPAGVVGELVVRGERGITLFAGYLDMPDVTEQSFCREREPTGRGTSPDSESDSASSARVGQHEPTGSNQRQVWFRTGDRAVRDERGRHFFDGRRSDVLKVAGENVSIVEVETVLAAHPGVLEAAVVGRPDPIRDEVPVAFVVPRDPAQPPSVISLRHWCEERLSKPKRPAEITLLDELPRTSVGKIRKFLLTDRASADLPLSGNREG